MQIWGPQFKPWKFPSWEQCNEDKLPKRVRKFHATLAQLRGLFGLNVVILFSTKNVINKKSYKFLFGKHCWTMLSWNGIGHQLEFAHFCQLEHNYLNSFYKTWGEQFLFYNKDYIDVRWSYCLPKMGKFFQCLVGMWFLSPWLCVCQPLGCFVFFFSLQWSFFHLCWKKKEKKGVSFIRSKSQ